MKRGKPLKASGIGEAGWFRYSIRKTSKKSTRRSPTSVSCRQLKFRNEEVVTERSDESSGAAMRAAPINLANGGACEFHAAGEAASLVQLFLSAVL